MTATCERSPHTRATVRARQHVVVVRQLLPVRTVDLMLAQETARAGIERQQRDEVVFHRGDGFRGVLTHRARERRLVASGTAQASGSRARAWPGTGETGGAEHAMLA